MFLLDTNVVSELRKGHRADAQVRAWSQLFPVTQFFVSAVTILEIEHGIQRLARRDPAQSALFSRWLQDHVLSEFDGRILSFDTAAALRCAALHVPDPRPERDSMIAATALVHALTLVTRNVEDFAGCGLAIINPWQPGASCA